jgi:hypothetical protein
MQRESIADPWVLGAAQRISIQDRKNIGAQAFMPEQLIFSIHKMEHGSAHRHW